MSQQRDQMLIQNFDWGIIQWLHEPNPINGEGLSVGHVIIFPRKTQHTHQHFSDEQVIFILSGRGEHVVNGDKKELFPGKVIHVPAMATHQGINISDFPLEMLVISAPVHANFLMDSDIASGWSYGDNHYQLSDIIDLSRVEKLLDSFSSFSSLGITLFDREGNLLTNPSGLPNFCLQVGKCTNSEYCTYAVKIAAEQAFETNGHVLFSCCLNIICLLLPIKIMGKTMAFLRCGHVFLTQPPKLTEQSLKEHISTSMSIMEYQFLLNDYNSIGVLPKNRLYGVAETLGIVMDSFIRLTIDNNMQRQLNEQKSSMLETLHIQSQLEKSLIETKLRVLQYQVNPHFLFNTLNIIGSLSIIEEAPSTSKAISALAKFFRYSLVQKDHLVALENELSALHDYLYIQELRFADRFKIILDISNEVKNCVLPFMTLQPLVENCFIHGLEPSSKKGILEIKGYLQDSDVEIIIQDNGVGIPSEELPYLNSGLTEIRNNGSVHGLGINNVRLRLQHYFGDKSNLLVESIQGKGTRYILSFPYTTQTDNLPGGVVC